MMFSLSFVGGVQIRQDNGAGFMCVAFLLRNELRLAGKLSEYITTMKWYNDFGEICQHPFEYIGTTADCMRTISLWRKVIANILYFLIVCWSFFLQQLNAKKTWMPPCFQLHKILMIRTELISRIYSQCHLNTRKIVALLL